ncbi:MAG: multiheme c-type cytochrome, partial [Candidatus Bathyarchaeia archaeon]
MILTTIAAMISASLIIDEGARNAPLILLSDQVYSRVAAGLSPNQAAIIPIVLGSLAMVIHSGRSWLNRNRGLAVKVVAVTSILVLIAQPTLISHMLPSNEKDEAPPIFVKAERRYSGRECLTCHIQATPVLFQQWNSSRHASSGVLCDACHGSDHDALIWPTGEQCRRCHAAQVEEFNSGKHHLAWVAMVPVVEILKLDESTVVKGCGLCHRIGSSGNTTNWGPNTPGVANTPGSKCDVCHTR